MASPSNDIYGMAPSRPDDYDAVLIESIAARWDRKAERWDADLADEKFHLNEDDAYRRFLDAADDVVAVRADFCRSQLLVDLGCGTGLVLAHFIVRFNRGLGVDISPRMLEVARRRQLPVSEFLQANGFELPRCVAAAGAVLSRGVLLSHYGRRLAPELMGAIRAALVPNGFAILDFLNLASRHKFASEADNKTYFEAAELAIMGRQAGFSQDANPRRAGTPRATFIAGHSSD